ncbi:MAG: hypothetical protein P8I94_07350 [Emcibacteraceae bacterium]|nr:hypothetical protein [Emcibacteraceae bacterium]
MKIVSAESLRVTTLSGAAIVFEAGAQTEVSDEVGLVALQMGAKEVKEGKAESEPEVVIEETSEEPSDDLVQVLEKMMDEGNPENFKADGSPKAAAVNKAMGKTVDADARDAAWESVLNS